MLVREELLLINAGASISGTLINSVVKAFNLVLEVGRALGSAIRRGLAKKTCPV